MSNRHVLTRHRNVSMDVGERASSGRLFHTFGAAEVKARDAIIVSVLRWRHASRSLSWFWSRPAGPSRTTAVSATCCSRRQVRWGTVFAGAAGPWKSSSSLCTRYANSWAASVMSVEVPLLTNDMMHHRLPSPARSGRAEDDRCCSRWLRKVWSCNGPDENKRLNKRLCSRLLWQLDAGCDGLHVDESFTLEQRRWCVRRK